MSAQSLFDSLQNYLQVKLTFTPSVPPAINVGEEFTMKVTVTNTAPGGINNPRVIFRNVRVIVRGTSQAEPTAGRTVTVNLDDQTLTNSDSGSVNVRMKAIREVFFDLNELVANVEVSADLDQNAFFQIRRRVEARTEIVPT